MKKLIVLAALPLLLAACKTNTSTQPSPTPITQGSSSPVIVALGQQNNSGENGTATLTESNGQVTVVLKMTGTSSSVPQPAHIHAGSCPTPGAVKFPLTNVVNGQSTTTLNTTMSALMAQGPMAVNVHKSAQQLADYVACGNLPNNGPAMASPSGAMQY